MGITLKSRRFEKPQISIDIKLQFSLVERICSMAELRQALMRKAEEEGEDYAEIAAAIKKSSLIFSWGFDSSMRLVDLGENIYRMRHPRDERNVDVICTERVILYMISNAEETSNTLPDEKCIWLLSEVVQELLKKGTGGDAEESAEEHNQRDNSATNEVIEQAITNSYVKLGETVVAAMNDHAQRLAQALKAPQEKRGGFKLSQLKRKPEVPNKGTKKAMADAKRGKTVSFDTVEDIMDDLKK
jgi:hypothetical protein